MDIKDKNLILASKSPRRIEILREHGLDPKVIPAQTTENIPLYHGMEETVMYISLKKAQATLELIKAGGIADELKGAVILAADTIVYKDGEIMGKPKDKADGFRMLSKIRGTYHYVATGVAIIDVEKHITHSFCDVTKVFLKYYSDEELDEYLDTPEAYDKAGGYGIQSGFAKYLEKIEGDYENVMGLPWYRVKETLESLDR